MFVLYENNYLSNIKSVLILKHKCFIHVHTISRKKARQQTFTRNNPNTDFRATFLYN